MERETIKSMKEGNLNLNLIRIFAAWMILIEHITQILGISFEAGAYGVQLFFIMSGYLAFYSMTNKRYSNFAYYKNRTVRILPTYWICLIILYLYDMLEGGISKLPTREIFMEQCGPGFIRYFFGLQCCLPSEQWYLWNNHSALWSMSSFFAFYLLTPYLYKILKKFYISFFGTIVLLIGRPLIINIIQSCLRDYPPDAHIEWFASLNPLSSLYCYLLGCSLYLAIKEEKQNIYMLIITVILFMTDFKWYPYELVSVILIFIAVSVPPLFKQKLSVKIVSYISNGTFTLYLIHPIVLRIAPKIWHKCGFSDNIFYIFYLFVASICAAYFIYYFGIKKIEKIIADKVYQK